MAQKLPVEIPREKLAEFCRRNRIRKLSVFGSVLREDFASSSDVDVLVEFEPDAKVGLFAFSRMERELSALLGRKVDLNTEGFLSDYFKDEVLKEAEVQFVQA
ncbi:MAG: nucleotidyltransferase family protein [Chloroflexota bacterium]